MILSQWSSNVDNMPHLLCLTVAVKCSSWGRELKKRLGFILFIYFFFFLTNQNTKTENYRMSLICVFLDKNQARVCARTRKHAGTHLCLSVCLSVSLSVSLCLCLCLSPLSLSLSLYIYIYIYIQTHVLLYVYKCITDPLANSVFTMNFSPKKYF